MLIGERIRQKRIAAGMSQEDLAHKISSSCTQKDISRWETGTRSPSLNNAIRLAQALNCSVEEILSEKESDLQPAINPRQP